MILIADSGSTKTDWCVAKDGETLKRFTTQGINPYHQDERKINGIVFGELLPQTSDYRPEKIVFYGSGCTEAKAPWLRLLLNDELASYGVTFDVYNDLLGAARALFGRTEGIACILGAILALNARKC